MSCGNPSLMECTCLPDGSGGVFISCDKFPNPLFGDIDTIQTVSISTEEDLGQEVGYNIGIWPNLELLYSRNNIRYKCINGVCRHKVNLFTTLKPSHSVRYLLTTSDPVKENEFNMTTTTRLTHYSSRTRSSGSGSATGTLYPTLHSQSTAAAAAAPIQFDTTTKVTHYPSSTFSNEKTTADFISRLLLSTMHSSTFFTEKIPPQLTKATLLPVGIQSTRSPVTKKATTEVQKTTVLIYSIQPTTSSEKPFDIPSKVDTKMNMTTDLASAEEIPTNFTITMIAEKVAKSIVNKGEQNNYFIGIGFGACILIIIILTIILLSFCRWVKYRRERPLSIPPDLNDL